MIIYLDNDYKCHVTDDGTMQPYETDRFDGYSSVYIEGYRLVPAGETWTREDGEVFGPGYEMLSPWKPLAELEAAQAAYEDVLSEAEKAYEEGVNSAYDTSLN